MLDPPICEPFHHECFIVKVTARQEIECKSCVFGSPDKIRDKRARVMLDCLDSPVMGLEDRKCTNNRKDKRRMEFIECWKEKGSCSVVYHQSKEESV